MTNVDAANWPTVATVPAIRIARPIGTRKPARRGANVLRLAAALGVSADWKLVGYFCLGYPQAEDVRPALERAGWERRRPSELFLTRR